MATKLGVSTFKATCCGQSFEGKAGATALEAHAKAEHKGTMRVIRPGGPHRYSKREAPGWKGGKIEKPYPWQAPKAPADTLRLTAALLKHDNDSDLLEWETREIVTPDTLRTGDLFSLKGCTYSVDSVEPDGLTLTMRTGLRPGTSGKVPLSSFDKLGGQVVLLNRTPDYEAPCGELYATEDDMHSHELTCGACAGAVEQAS